MVPRVGPMMKNRLEKDLEREKKNMFYLVQPSMSKV